MRKLVLLLALLSAPLAVAANASADRPQVFTVPFVDSSVDTDTCGASLPINDTRTGTIRFTTFADGSQIRHGDVTVTLSANGKTLTYDQHFNVFITDTSRTVVGLVGTIKVPGYGTVVEAGRLVLGPDGVVFESGRHQLFNGDVAGLCSYLSS
ncbi:MAG: hypothetical protein ACJ752_05335 [Gaiellaceae bacterium]